MKAVSAELIPDFVKLVYGLVHRHSVANFGIDGFLDFFDNLFAVRFFIVVLVGLCGVILLFVLVFAFEFVPEGFSFFGDEVDDFVDGAVDGFGYGVEDGFDFVGEVADAEEGGEEADEEGDAGGEGGFDHFGDAGLAAVGDGDDGVEDGVDEFD
ncbi:hypothetical protein ACFYW1_38495, partial [Streptomyces sp. NPDC002669]